MSVKQTHNYAHGDITGGNKITYHIHSNPQFAVELSKLYEKIKQDGIGDPSGGQFCDQIEHYLAAKTNGDVRGLSTKLDESGRKDQIDLATELKENATKAVMRHQTSRTAQRVYTIILDELHAAFTLTITPVIQADGSRETVDARIKEMLDSVAGMLGDNLFELTKKDLLALLYFLGGNCHIRWDKC